MITLEQFKPLLNKRVTLTNIEYGLCKKCDKKLDQQSLHGWE
jgi:hypothetical protein